MAALHLEYPKPSALPRSGSHFDESMERLQRDSNKFVPVPGINIINLKSDQSDSDHMFPCMLAASESDPANAND